jgi:hypothetical protein
MFASGLTANELLVAGLAGAVIVLCGGLYALFLALSLMHGRFRDRVLAYLNFSLLLVAFIVLAKSLHMNALWHAVIMFLMLAYLISPYLIWKLTKATHGEHNNGATGNE